MSCDTKTPYAGDEGILPHQNGKFVIGKLKSSFLSYIYLQCYNLPYSCLHTLYAMFMIIFDKAMSSFNKNGKRRYKYSVVNDKTKKTYFVKEHSECTKKYTEDHH